MAKSLTEAFVFRELYKISPILITLQQITEHLTPAWAIGLRDATEYFTKYAVSY